MIKARRVETIFNWFNSRKRVKSLIIILNKIINSAYDDFS